MKKVLLHIVLVVFVSKITLQANEWDSVPQILSRIVEPVFPDTNFYITDYGAVGDSNTICSDAFRKAIDSCYAAGGGKVIVDSGIYITWPIHLKSNVNLYVSKNAKVVFTRDIDAYFPKVYTRYQGVEFMGYSPLIYAFEQENIAVTGSGILHGQGGLWNAWAEGGNDFSTLLTMATDSVPVEERVFEDDRLRPSMIQPYKCTNVFIDSIQVREGPFWHIHPVLCKNVKVTNVSVVGPWHNNDGCNPESCTDVLIKNCYFDTGDDCIAIKAGRDDDGRRVNTPSKNIVIQNCTMKDGHGGVVVGSEATGGVNYIFAEIVL